MKPWERYKPQQAAPEVAPEVARGPWEQYVAPVDTTPDFATVVQNLARTAADTPRYLGNAGLSMLQGVNDLPIGAAQFVTHLPGVPDAAGQAVDDYIKFRDQKYSELRGDDGGINPGRVAGNVLTAIPFAGQTAAPTLLGRMGQGARAGAILGATTPVNSDTGYWGPKARDIGAGLVLGGGAPAVIDPALSLASVAGGALAKGLGVSGLIKRASDAAGGFVSRLAGNEISPEVSQVAKAAGLDLDSLSPEVRSSMVEQIQNALLSGKAVDPKAVGRLADFKQLNIEPTLGQVSRDPAQLRLEQSLSRNLGDRYAEQNQAMIGALDAPIKTDAYAAGQDAINALKAGDVARKANVDSLYNSARNLAGADAVVPMKPVQQKLSQLLEDYGSENLPAAVKARLAEYDGGVKQFTLREAEKLRTLISNNVNPANPPQASFLTKLKASVDDAVHGLADSSDIGADAAKAFGAARSAASDRFGINEIPGVKSALEGVNYEDFVRRHVIGGGMDDVKALFGQLDSTAKESVKSQVLNYLKSQATGNTADEFAKFSPKRFNDALSKLDNGRLETIFSPAEVAKLRQLQNVSGATSPTSGVAGRDRLISALEGMEKFPVLGAIAGKPADLVRAAKAQTALKGVLALPPGPTSGLLTGLIGTDLAGALMQR